MVLDAARAGLRFQPARRVRTGDRHLPSRQRRTARRHPGRLQGAHLPRVDDLPDLPVHPACAHMEWVRGSRLPLPSVSDRAHTPHVEADRGAGMTVTVTGIVAEPAAQLPPQGAAARELLRQRAVAAGLVAEDAGASESDAAIERLLEREVVTPEPGEEECRRYYEAH